ncbi:hypothetical protein ACFWPH_07080 [Nocardia sp. NPDC058499]|uniref:hypothetical protein n=1 Tax=Nocardia sp. NPDC058499 TaxID=3346530 RepID=UPI003646B741
MAVEFSCRSRFSARRSFMVDEGFFSDFPRDLSATVAPVFPKFHPTDFDHTSEKIKSQSGGSRPRPIGGS